MPVTRTSLLIRVRDSSDLESWQEFTAIYYPFIFRCARAMGLPDDDAQDVVQDVFIAFFRCASRFTYRELRGSFRGWLKTITCNKIRDLYRRRRVRHHVQLEDVPDASFSDEGPWERDHRMHVIQHALKYVRARSDEQTWQCFHEHVLKGRKAREVAAELNVSVNAVYVNSTRTMGRLRERCREFNEELGDGP